MKKSIFYIMQIVGLSFLTGCASYQWPTLGGDSQNSAQKVPTNPRLIEKDLSGATLAPVQIYLSTGLRTDIQTETPDDEPEKQN